MQGAAACTRMPPVGTRWKPLEFWGLQLRRSYAVESMPAVVFALWLAGLAGVQFPRRAGVVGGACGACRSWHGRNRLQRNVVRGVGDTVWEGHCGVWKAGLVAAAAALAAAAVDAPGGVRGAAMCWYVTMGQALHCQSCPWCCCHDFDNHNCPRTYYFLVS